MAIRGLSTEEVDLLVQEFLDSTSYDGQVRPWRDVPEADEDDDDREDTKKAEYKFGNTHVVVDPWSSAAAHLNAARDAISDADLLGNGKDIEQNHVTVRYGLLNADVDALRIYINGLTPFVAHVGEVILFPASEHSEGAVPVVAEIVSPELHAIEKEIGKYAAFKEKNFPVYKPHCTLAYCKPEAAQKYAELPVAGSFLVSTIMISHQSGVKETIQFGAVRKANPYHDEDGKFTSKDKAVDEVYFHGTVKEFREAILKEGLKSEDERLFPGDERNDTRTWMTTSLKEAKKYSTLRGRDSSVPVLVTVKIPAEHVKDLYKYAEKTSPLDTRVRFPRAIPPEWIVSISDFGGTQKSDGKTIYVVVFVSDKAKKADPTGRYVTPFVNFDQQGNSQLQLIASLNASRLATWGFTAEAEVRGIARYRVSAVLDGRTSQFCRMINGHIFQVADARKKVIEVLNVQNPEDLRVVQPWPKQSKADMEAYSKMSTAELTALGFHIPPYHPGCRSVLKDIKSSEGDLKEVTPDTPAAAEQFQAVTAADLKEIGVDATPQQVTQWNEHLHLSPVELLSRLTGMNPQQVMTKGVGSKAIQIDPLGEIAIQAKGITNDVAFQMGAVLDPFTGTFYLTHADLLQGTPAKEAAFLRNMFLGIVEVAQKSSATSVAAGVAGNVAYFAKLGFLPDGLDWDAIRTAAMADEAVQAAVATLTPEDGLLVRGLLQDAEPGALSALVDMPFQHQGRSIGEIVLSKVSGIWSLDLTDKDAVAQLKAYLS